MEVMRAILAVLMLTVLFIPLPWLYYESGHYYIGILTYMSWWGVGFLGLSREFSSMFEGMTDFICLACLTLSISWIGLGVGYTFLFIFNLVSVIVERLWMSRMRVGLVLLFLFSALISLVSSEAISIELLPGFWFPVGLVVISGFIEGVGLIRSCFSHLNKR